MLHRSPTRVHGRHVLFLPNWRVVPARDGSKFQSPDVYPDDGRYWFFRNFKEEWSVDVLDAAWWPGWRLEERYLHFYLTQALPALSALSLLRRYNLVFAHGVQSVVALSAMLRIFSLRHPPMVVVDPGALNGGRPDRRLSFAATRWALAEATSLIWHASGSAELCKTMCPELAARGTFIPLGINDYELAGVASRDGDYVVCPGYAQRDWSTLLKAWASLPTVPLKLIGVPETQFTSLPTGAAALPPLPFDEYRECVANARLVILPLPDGWASWGQMTLLQAMALGKPVIVSDVRPVSDYIGPWCHAVRPDNAEELRHAVLRLWNDRALRSRLSEAAKEAVAHHFSERRMAVAFEAVMRDAVTSPSR